MTIPNGALQPVHHPFSGARATEGCVLNQPIVKTLRKLTGSCKSRPQFPPTIRRNFDMKKLPRSLVLAAFALALTFPLSRHVPAVSADSGQQGDLHIEKNCSAYTGDAGQYCTITSSNVRQIPPGSRVFYDQAAGDPDVPPPMLDSNVVLYVGTANWAVGRCSLDLTTYLG